MNLLNLLKVLSMLRISKHVSVISHLTFWLIISPTESDRMRIMVVIIWEIVNMGSKHTWLWLKYYFMVTNNNMIKKKKMKHNLKSATQWKITFDLIREHTCELAIEKIKMPNPSQLSVECFSWPVNLVGREKHYYSAIFIEKDSKRNACHLR